MENDVEMENNHVGHVMKPGTDDARVNEVYCCTVGLFERNTPQVVRNGEVDGVVKRFAPDTFEH